jgi:hypothetical protein
MHNICYKGDSGLRVVKKSAFADSAVCRRETLSDMSAAALSAEAFIVRYATSG